MLHGTDLLGDFLGRAARLGGQFFHFAGNDGEAAAGLPAARSLDRGIQRKKVRPLRDRLDKLDDLSDLFGRRGQGGNGFVRPVGSIGRSPCKVGGM